MNTARILDILPTATAAPGGPAAAVPQERPAPAVAPVASSPDGGTGGVPDAVRQRVAAEVERQTERRTLAEEASAAQTMTNRVGFFDGTTMVFVDLLDARTQRALLRVFGPSEPREPPVEPAQASEAYRAASRLPDGDGQLRI